MLKDKVVLITGGSSGIGKATAIMFAKNNATVVITYKDNKNKKDTDKTIGEIKKLGQNAIAIKADLTNENQIKNIVSTVMKKFGRIDILVNNVGERPVKDSWNVSSNIWINSLRLNLLSMMILSKYVIQIFLKQKSGIIINISSRRGVDGQYDAISYSASKAGVINITQSYAKLLSNFGRANSICPGAVNSGYWLIASKEELEKKLKKMPNHKLIEPEKIAKKILFLASNKAKNINGKNFTISR